MLANRDFVIDRLINDDIDTIESSAAVGDFDYVGNVLKYGFCGYFDYSDAELVQEMNERGFEEEIVYE